MKLTESGNDGLGTKAELRRAARVPSRSGIRKDLQVGNWRARRFEQCEYLGLGVECIERLGLARLPASCFTIAGQKQAEGRMLAVAQITAADLEQPDRAGAPIGVAARCGDQAGEQRRAHHLHLFADGIGELPVTPSENLRLTVGDETPRYRLVDSAGGGGSPDPTLDHLRAGRGRLGDAGCAV